MTDTFCQEHCNPYAWSELHKDGKWVFNSSIAEQTNVWVGGYHSIVREMLGDHYKFFLDQMIMLHNSAIIEKLERRGQAPFAGANL